MYCLIFYKTRYSNPLGGHFEDLMISIEEMQKLQGEGSILAFSEQYPDQVTIQNPPRRPDKMYLTAETLTEAHYLCMRYGYRVMFPTSTMAEYHGPHICGTLEKEYEQMLEQRKEVKGA